MIQRIEDRCERRFDVGEIHDPAVLGRRFARNVYVDAERMPVQACAFVPGRHVREPMRGFNRESFENLHGFHVGCAAAKVVARGGIEPPTSAL